MRIFSTLASLKYLVRKNKTERTEEKNERKSIEKILREMQKLVWLDINKKEFEELQ